MQYTRRMFGRMATAAGLCLAVAFGGFAAQAQEPTTLKMNLVISNQDPVFAYWQDFAKDIEKASEGTLKVEVYPTETLGKTTDMIEAISRGAPVLQDSDPSHLSNYVADYAVFMNPYLFKEPRDIEKAWKSEIGQRMEKELNEKGLRILTLVYFGTRNLMCDQPVLKREEAADLKVRNAPTKMWNEVGKVLGGITVNTAWTEVYTALSQGVADCAESPLNVLYSTKFHELRKHINMTEHLVASTSIIMSQQLYDSLPPKAQEALDTVGRSYPAVRAEQIRGIEKEYREKLEAEGVTFHDDVDKSGFIEAAANVSEAFPEWTPGLYDQMLEAIKSN
ncbi:TRAP transporter substrate-binding protein DctP [Chelativorans alearense]|uniref:TRAP transporter substrate-binding protein DctP n=1 Tax=Chelativorans alearense TaxID=2681495 RepID=UPI0013D009E7|nr:TRAP transporter substrate-binding protein DctP [Chelativorans alearense]